MGRLTLIPTASRRTAQTGDQRRGDAERVRSAGPLTVPAQAANIARNADASGSRALRWRSTRSALWHLLDRHVAAGAVVAVVGAGNTHDIPLRRLCRRARRVDLIDLDAAALNRAGRRRLPSKSVRSITEDVTLGSADTITRAAASGERPNVPQLARRPVGEAPYDVVIGDLVYSQLLYPGLADAGLPGPAIDNVLLQNGQALTDAVVARLHASTRGGLVIHLHDLLAWWPGHTQPFTLDQILNLAEHDPHAALTLAQGANVPYGCDPRAASKRLGGDVLDTAFWRWPFAPSVDYLIVATVVRATVPGGL